MLTNVRIQAIVWLVQLLHHNQLVLLFEGFIRLLAELLLAHFYLSAYKLSYALNKRVCNIYLLHLTSKKIMFSSLIFRYDWLSTKVAEEKCR